MHHKAKEPEWVVNAARGLRELGWTYLRISNKLEVPYWTVRDWLTYRTRING